MCWEVSLPGSTFEMVVVEAVVVGGGGGGEKGVAQVTPLRDVVGRHVLHITK